MTPGGCLSSSGPEGLPEACGLRSGGTGQVQLRAGAGGLSDKPSGIRAGAAASMTGVDVHGRQHAGKPETTVAAKTTA